jgi:hypothetical protein
MRRTSGAARHVADISQNRVDFAQIRLRIGHTGRTNGSPVCRCGVGSWTIGQRCDLVDPGDGDPMEMTPSDRLAAQIHFAKARENLRALAALVQPLAPGVTPDAVRAAIAAAAEALDVAAHALDANAPDAARIACSFCGNPVLRTATLCGSCWHKLDRAESADDVGGSASWRSP